MSATDTTDSKVTEAKTGEQKENKNSANVGDKRPAGEDFSGN